MKRNQIRFIGYCLTIGIIVALTLIMAACSSKTAPKLSSIEISPSSPPNVTVGSTFQLTATGIYSDGSTANITQKVTWESSNTGTIITGTGLVSGMETGTASITATLNGITSAPLILTVVSAFQGSANGNWSGQMIIGRTTTTLSGTFSATIDENGAVTGIMNGAYSGSITGQVAANGNLTGTGNFTVGSTAYVTNWTGTVTVLGTSLNIQGTWTGAYDGSGVFSGSGTTSN